MTYFMLGVSVILYVVALLFLAALGTYFYQELKARQKAHVRQEASLKLWEERFDRQELRVHIVCMNSESYKNEINAVFSTEELAKGWIENTCKLGVWTVDDFFIEEWVVDLPFRPWEG